MRVTKDFTLDALALLGGETVVEEHLRIDISADGTDRAHVLLLAEASIRYIQEITGRTFVDGTATVDLETLPSTFEVPFLASSIRAVTYLDTDNQEASLDVAGLDLYATTAPAIVAKNKDFSAPSNVSTSAPYPYKITFNTSADIPINTNNVGQVKAGILEAAQTAGNITGTISNQGISNYTPTNGSGSGYNVTFAVVNNVINSEQLIASGSGYNAGDVLHFSTFGQNFYLTLVESNLTQTTSAAHGLFKACCLLYLSHLYENRQAVTSGGFRPYVMPLAFESLIKTLKRYP